MQKLDKWLLWVVSLTILMVVAINFITSYQHIYDLGLKYGEYGVDARLMPVGIDGMLLALGLANVFAARFLPTLANEHKAGRRTLRFALAFGVGGTVAANGAYGAHWGMTGNLLGVWSPVALFIAVESGLFMFKIAAEWVAQQQEQEESVLITEAKKQAAAERRQKYQARRAKGSKQSAQVPGTDVVLGRVVRDPFLATPDPAL